MASTRKPVVLVTGGAGYIGSHAVLALRDLDWPVVVLDNLSTGRKQLVPKDVPFQHGDVGDIDLVMQLIKTHDVGAVLHFAASIIVPESVRDPLKYYRNNSCNARNLLEAVTRAGVRHFLFSSTAAVYGIPAKTPITEDMPKAPINPYGRSKWMMEMMLADVAQAHPMNYCALRYFNVAGADPQGRSGQCTEAATHLIKIAVEAALSKRSHVSICGTDYATPDGTGVRDYIHVSDLAAAHVLALQALIDAPSESLVMNCGYGQGSSVLQVLDAVERVSGIVFERRFEGRRLGDPDILIADNSLITKKLGWQPRYNDLQQIVADALSWEKKLSS